jgi:hypothetical protein
MARAPSRSSSSPDARPTRRKVELFDFPVSGHRKLKQFDFAQRARGIPQVEQFRFSVSGHRKLKQFDFAQPARGIPQVEQFRFSVSGHRKVEQFAFPWSAQLTQLDRAPAERGFLLDQRDPGA